MILLELQHNLCTLSTLDLLDWWWIYLAITTTTLFDLVLWTCPKYITRTEFPIAKAPSSGESSTTTCCVIINMRDYMSIPCPSWETDLLDVSDGQVVCFPSLMFCSLSFNPSYSSTFRDSFLSSKGLHFWKEKLTHPSNSGYSLVPQQERLIS